MDRNVKMAFALVLAVFAMSSYSVCASQTSDRRRLRRRTHRHEATRLYGIDSTSKKSDLGRNANDSDATPLETQVEWEVERLLNADDTSASMSMPPPTTVPPTPNQSATTEPPTKESITEPPTKEFDLEPPTKEFDFNECDTYSTEWLLELASSCDSLTSFDNCECPTAKALLQNNTISCANETEFGVPSMGACPEGCKVCQFCMVTSGCPDIYGVAGEQLPFARKLDVPTST